MPYRALLFTLIAPLVVAEELTDPLALWAFGTGTHMGQPSVIGNVVMSGDDLTAGEQPVRLELLGFPGSDLILSPGSTIQIRRNATHRERLHIDVRGGSLEVDLRGSGTSTILDVRGAALNVRCHDCLLLIERDPANADYVAVISGQAMAGIRPGLNIEDGGMAIMLQARQGLRCSSANGLAEVDQLEARPQLLAAATLQKQGQKTGDTDSWALDDAALATNDPPSDGGITRLPAVAVVVIAEVPPLAEPPAPPLAVVTPPPVIPDPTPAPPFSIVITPPLAPPATSPPLAATPSAPLWQRGRSPRSMR